MGESVHRNHDDCTTTGYRIQSTLSAGSLPACRVTDTHDTAMCPLPEQLGLWLSHPMVHRRFLYSSRCLALPSSASRRLCARWCCRGAPPGGPCAMWSAYAVRECRYDPGFIYHLPFISHHSHYLFPLSCLSVAGYPCPPVACVARLEHTQDL